ncbi:MAG: hypothetical protein ACRDTE_21450 [Pseudonocardiaceae bacterium]
MTGAGGVTHLVTDAAMIAGRSRGLYTAVCDRQVIAASLTTPASGYCQDCRRWRAGA